MYEACGQIPLILTVAPLVSPATPRQAMPFHLRPAHDRPGFPAMAGHARPGTAPVPASRTVTLGSRDPRTALLTQPRENAEVHGIGYWTSRSSPSRRTSDA